MQATLQTGLHRRAAWAFGLACLLTIVLGAVVMSQGGIPPGIWIRNPVGWLVATAAGVILASRGWLGFPVTFAAVAVVILSLFGPGQLGVHRWVGAGPVQLNAAALVLPLATAVFTSRRAWMTAACFVIIAGVIARQPDISQLAGLVVAGVILFASAFGWTGALASLVVGGLVVAVCLMQPDPLLPVPHVEGIFQLAWSQSPFLGIGLAAALAASTLAPLLVWPVADLRWRALALSGYFAATSLAPLFGAYPVPLAGYGLSFVAGWALGLAALTQRLTRNP